MVSYSTRVRLVTAVNEQNHNLSLAKHNPATAVLPDHFLSGQWSYVEERFPTDSQFVLATDGFYSAFPDSKALWCWLQDHGHELEDEESRERILLELHQQLHAKSGDDDISFVWVRPRQDEAHGS